MWAVEYIVARVVFHYAVLGKFRCDFFAARFDYEAAELLLPAEQRRALALPGIG